MKCDKQKNFEEKYWTDLRIRISTKTFCASGQLVLRLQQHGPPTVINSVPMFFHSGCAIFSLHASILRVHCPPRLYLSLWSSRVSTSMRIRIQLLTPYVAHLWFLRDVWIRTQSAAVASWRATDLATHPSLFFRPCLCPLGAHLLGW